MQFGRVHFPDAGVTDRIPRQSYERRSSTVRPKRSNHSAVGDDEKWVIGPFGVGVLDEEFRSMYDVAKRFATRWSGVRVHDETVADTRNVTGQFGQGFPFKRAEVSFSEQRIGLRCQLQRVADNRGSLTRAPEIA